ncbi:MAG: hypothetical protein JF603_15870 [Acidobacteria bacterium]|nr:hypothetical protein [Acidobacteriota bacterium]
MACWIFTTPTVSEAPFAWNALMERFRIDRGVSVVEVSPHVYEQVRFDAYTNELGAVNLGPNPNADDPDFYPAPRTGLHYFRGGYEWRVDDQVRSDIIASGAADASNFVLCPDQSFGYGEGGYGDGEYGG